VEAIVIIGGGDHAKVIINLVKKIGKYDIIGYIDNESHGLILGVPFLGSDNDLDNIAERHPGCHAAIGIGHLSISDRRKNIFLNLKTKGFLFPSLISPDSIVNEEVTIDEGAVVMDGCIIQPGVSIGKCVIVNTRSSMDHDCAIGDFAHVAPGVTLSGSVSIGEGAILGAGSVVTQGKNIAPNCIIGAGATIVSDCLEQGIYLGTPGRKKGEGSHA